MNQSATFDPVSNAIVATKVTPYQKVDDYFKNQNLLEKVCCVAEQTPATWCANQAVFEGEVGLHASDGIYQSELANT